MRPSLTHALIVALTLSQAGPAAAELFGHHRPPPSSSTPQHVDCDMVAANPGAAMDKATCESMNAAAAAYSAAEQDPAGARPGDDALTCDQIKTEFMSQPMSLPSQEHLAQTQAAASEVVAKSAKIQAEATAAAAAGAGMNMAASAAEAANPVAGRAASAAADAYQAATQARLNAEAKAEVTPAAHRMNSGMGSVMSDMTPMMSNPRTAHLMQLATNKRCRF